MNDLEISRLPAVQLAQRIRSCELTARQSVEASLAAIALRDPELRAFITVAADSALREADRLDALAAKGEFVGPLHGVPISVKDLIATAGIVTTRGAVAHRNDIPASDDLIVARLKRAGGIVIGKTNTPQYGFGALCQNDLVGNTANPYATDRTSGGSSGGAAVAVATGMSALSLGSDFGGSVRTPAGFCNVVGFRPGAGLIPKVPKSLLWETLSSYGAMARTVADAALMLGVMVGSDERDPTTLGAVGLPVARPKDGQSLRIAASRNLGIATIAAEVTTVIERAVDRIGTLDLRLEWTEPGFAGAQDAFETLRAALLFLEFGTMIDDPAIDVSPTVLWNVERGRNLSASQVYTAETVRARIYQNCVSFFESHDFLVLPAASVAPWPLEQTDVLAIDGKPMRNIVDYLTITYAISLVGLPVISLPCGWTDKGLPIGMQIVAGPRREADLLAFAARLERELGFRHSFPSDPHPQLG